MAALRFVATRREPSGNSAGLFWNLPISASAIRRFGFCGLMRWGCGGRGGGGLASPGLSLHHSLGFSGQNRADLLPRGRAAKCTVTTTRMRVLAAIEELGKSEEDFGGLDDVSPNFMPTISAIWLGPSASSATPAPAAGHCLRNLRGFSAAGGLATQTGQRSRHRPCQRLPGNLPAPPRHAHEPDGPNRALFQSTFPAAVKIGWKASNFSSQAYSASCTGQPP